MKKVAKRRKKGVMKYVVIYNGPHKAINITPGIGRCMRGEPFEVTKEVANTLKLDSNFIVKEKRKMFEEN